VADATGVVSIDFAGGVGLDRANYLSLALVHVYVDLEAGRAQPATPTASP